MGGNVTAVWAVVLVLLHCACARLQSTEGELSALVEDLLSRGAADPVADTLKYYDAWYARAWLRTTNRKLRDWCYVRAKAEWDFSTNVTEQNENKLSEVVAAYSGWYQGVKEEAAMFHTDFLDSDTQRQLRLLRQTINSRNSKTVRNTSHIRTEMMRIYDTGLVCRDSGQCLTLEPELEKVMAGGHDPADMLWAWRGWHNVTGPGMRPLYAEFVNLTNQGARENGFQDFGDYLRQATFDQTDDIEALAESLWEQVRPLYRELHAYVRRKLTERYGPDVVTRTGAIPAHLLGNMWAQEWTNTYSMMAPYPEADRKKEAARRVRKRFTVEGLFRLAEEFFTSLGLYPMTPAFWRHSMLRRPKDREVQCHASALDMFHDGDYRIKMCTEVDLRHLETVHHEMGHVEYFMAYSGQPTIYRDGANCAFHEAVGDTIALAVLSNAHLQSIGLLPPAHPRSAQQDEINSLMRTALYKVAFLPFGLLVDKWRYDVWRGKTDQTNFNRKWWEFRLKYQGVISPVQRSEEDFDPGAKFHIPANSPYMCYFFSNVVQFQFYRALCEASGHLGPLHKCDFYKSKAAGIKLKSMMELGQSVPWPDALETLTGSRFMAADAMLEYFQPLLTWLREDNRKHGVHVGWEEAEVNWAGRH